MSIEKGLLVSDLVSRVLVDVSDPNQRRWSSDQVVKFLNEGIRELAGEGVFRRTDIHVPASGQSFFAAFAEVHRIRGVSFDGARLTASRGDRSTLAAPERHACYVAGKGGVHLHPAPSRAGTPLTFIGAPPISETTGGKVDGDGFLAALNAGTVAHFREGDGHVPDSRTARGNVRIEYSFFPRPSESADTVASRYADALVVYAVWRCFNLSQVPEEVARGQVLAGLWSSARERVATAAGADMLTDDTAFAPLEAC
jgi:hypothetical protein